MPVWSRLSSDRPWGGSLFHIRERGRMYRVPSLCVREGVKWHLKVGRWSSAPYLLIYFFSLSWYTFLASIFHFLLHLSAFACSFSSTFMRSPLLLFGVRVHASRPCVITPIFNLVYTADLVNNFSYFFPNMWKKEMAALFHRRPLLHRKSQSPSYCLVCASVSPPSFYTSSSLLDICLTYRYGMSIFLLLPALPTLSQSRKALSPGSFLVSLLVHFVRTLPVYSVFGVDWIHALQTVRLMTRVRHLLNKREARAAVLLRFFCAREKKKKRVTAQRDVCA